MIQTRAIFQLLDHDSKLLQLESALQGPSRRETRIMPVKEDIAAGAMSEPLFKSELLSWAFCQFSLESSLLPPEIAAIPRVQKLLKQDLILFNVLVALDWTPDDAFVDSLQTAFNSASALLYDVTDGYMAFGQIVIGGVDLMEYADIQIFASNRFFPRSSVNGMNERRKYQPIRLGRGLWNKQTRTTIDWDQGDYNRNQFGPQTLVHEWGHYALGMKDQYLKPEDGKFVLPSFSPVKRTIMANLTGTEFAGTRTIKGRPAKIAGLLSTRSDEAQDDNEWQVLSLNPPFRSLDIDADHTPVKNREPLVPVPSFYLLESAAGNQSPLTLRLQEAESQYSLAPEHCWVYVIKGAKIDQPTELIAQGTLDDAPERFRLFGAEVGDFVLLSGNTSAPSPAFEPLILWSKIETADEGRPWQWNIATPTEFPLISVSVKAKDDSTPPRYTITVEGHDSRWELWTFPREWQRGTSVQRVERNPLIYDLGSLEGHVMLVSKDRKLAIAEFAIGGSPGNSGDTGHPNPLPAGSAEGNAMLFFYDATRNPLKYGPLYPPNSPEPLALYYEQFKIVTSTNTINLAPPSSKDWIPCSYAFSVTSNISFTKLDPDQKIDNDVYTVDLHPTLVLYYDDHTSTDADVELTIGHYEPSLKEWIIRDARETDSIDNKPDRNLIALSLNKETAPGLYAESPEPEYYRLFKKISPIADR